MIPCEVLCCCSTEVVFKYFKARWFSYYVFIHKTLESTEVVFSSHHSLQPFCDAWILRNEVQIIITSKKCYTKLGFM